MLSSTERALMRRALRLALRGRGRVSPNPRVGAVVVSSDGAIIGEGHHDHFGGPHAEVAALEACRDGDTRGATLYVNLEPCCTQGKTPPCSQAIERSGICKVVAAVKDPNPQVSGAGFAHLEGAGIEVEVGLLADEARYLNRGYFSHQERGRAWCAAKVALSIDGRMADAGGRSRWITGPAARRLAHRMRADHDGVLVGGGTVRNDDPELTVRDVRGSNPVRIILSPRRGIPLKSRIAATVGMVRTILVTGDGMVPEGLSIDRLEVIRMPVVGDGLLDPEALLGILPRYGVLSVLVEGGSSVLSSFMQAGVVDEISVGIGPSIIGRGLSPFDSFIPSSWGDRPLFTAGSIKRSGGDIIIIYRRGNGTSSPD